MNGWTRISILKLAQLTQSAPERLRWRWIAPNKKNGPKLQLVSPRGAVWDFRLRGGAWIKRVEPNVGLAQKKAAPTAATAVTS